MATLTQTGKRSKIEGELTMSARSSNIGQWENFSISVQEEGDFPRNSSYRWHSINVDRNEAQRIVNYLTERLAEETDGYGQVRKRET